MFLLVGLVVVVDEYVVNDVDVLQEMKSKILMLIMMNLNFDDESMINLDVVRGIEKQLMIDHLHHHHLLVHLLQHFQLVHLISDLFDVDEHVFEMRSVHKHSYWHVR